jgi:hypothetical protein
MQKLKHNKKRNTGLLYEFFTRYIGKAILDGRDSDITKAKTLLKKHFNKSTDIYKELKLFKALSESTTTNRDQALHLINRVREAVRYQSQARLDLEKTSLIHEVNGNLNAELFFEENIADYKKLATIQVLLNTWRDETLKEAVSETVQLEERLIEYMLERKASLEQVSEAAQMTTEDVDRLVVNIMTDKVNRKYSNLTLEQKNIISLFVFSKDDASAKAQLTEALDSLKNRFLGSLAAHQHEFASDTVLKNKLEEIRKTLQKEYNDTSAINEELVSFYLGLSKLEGEVRAK